MEYRIVITRDNKKKKTLHTGKNLANAKSRFFSLVDKNVVLFPKSHTSIKKTKPVLFEILLLKEREEGDPTFYDRDALGRTIPVNTKRNKWTIVEKRPYYYEEKFTVFGSRKRFETKDILRQILLPSIKREGVVKQVNYVLNKLMIWFDGDFDVILCKCEADARKLHNVLRDFCEKQKIKNVIFSGNVTKRNRENIYKMIVEKTGWSRNKVYRSVTRP
jgi:hypothetical protein